jgi:hypothetical protein
MRIAVMVLGVVIALLGIAAALWMHAHTPVCP